MSGRQSNVLSVSDRHPDVSHLSCTVMYCTVLYSIILYCTEMYCVSPVRSQLGLTVRHVGRESHEAARARLVPGLQQGWREFGESPPVQGVVLVVTGVTGSVPRAHGECVETLAAYKCQHLNREEQGELPMAQTIHIKVGNAYKSYCGADQKHLQIPASMKNHSNLLL